VNECKPLALGMSSDTHGWYGLCKSYFMSKTVEVLAAAFTAFTNVLLAAIIRTLSTLERHHTQSGLEAGAYTRPLLSST